MAKFNEYTQKATPEDADTLMIYDAAAKANKLSPFSGIWNWMVNKLTNAVINNLQTSNKTVVGGLNELNSNRLFDIYRNYSWKTSHSIDVSKANTLLMIAFGGSNGDQSIVLPLTKTGTDTWLYNAEYLATTNFAISCKSNVLTITNTATFLCFLVKVI